MEIDEYIGANKQSIFGEMPRAVADEESQPNQIQQEQAQFQDQPIDDSEEPKPPYTVSISEYEEIAQRFESSLRQLEQIQIQLKSDQDTELVRQKVAAECEKMTLRLRILKLESEEPSQQDSRQVSSNSTNTITYLYKVLLVDINTAGFAVLKRPQKITQKLKPGDSYIADKIKIVISPQRNLMLQSTTLTVFEMESDCEVESLEFSQKQREHIIDFKNELVGVNLETTGVNNPNQGFDMRLIFVDQCSQPESLPVLSSTKQIKTHAEAMLQEWGEGQQTQRLKSFTEILSWKIPTNFLSTSARESQEKLARRQQEEGYVCSYATHSHLYQLDLVTNRVREQNVSFVGIVQYVKEITDKGASSVGKDSGAGNMYPITSHVDLESTEDKSRVSLFIKHSRKVNLKPFLLKGMVLVVKDALRKISNTIDIYTQMHFSVGNLRVIGTAKEDTTDFNSKNNIQLIRTIPTDQIVRYIFKVLGCIIDTNFIKIQYKCDTCRRDISNEQMCSSGCIIKNPQLSLQVLCIVQDGTSKASLELKGQRVLAAFSVTDAQQRMFKDYCLKFGAFQNPSSTQNVMYKGVVNVFKRHECWSQMIFYCKPYAKVQNDRRQQNAGRQYGETISKPSFMVREREKEIFLNGEVQLQKKTQGYGEQGRTIKKTILCMKALQVDNNLNHEALRNTVSLKNAEYL